VVDVGLPVLSVEWSGDASVSSISSVRSFASPVAATTEDQAQQTPEGGFNATKKALAGGFSPISPPRNPTRLTRKSRDAPRILPLQAPRGIEKVTPKLELPSKPHSDARNPSASAGLQVSVSFSTDSVKIKDNRRWPQLHGPHDPASSQEAQLSICSQTEDGKIAASPHPAGITLQRSEYHDEVQHTRGSLPEVPIVPVFKRRRLFSNDSPRVSNSSRNCEYPQTVPHETHGIFQNVAGIQVKSQPPATLETTLQSQLVFGKHDPERLDALDDPIDTSSCKPDRRTSDTQLVHLSQCLQGQCQAQCQDLSPGDSSRGCKLEKAGGKCKILRCNFMAFDRDAVHQLQIDTSLLKRVVEDLREEFWALKNVLLESESRRRWKDMASENAV
jgi:hypothetical protein